MKRGELLKILKEQGCIFIKHGGKHDHYMPPQTGIIDYIPRHPDVREPTAWKIIKNLSKS